MTKEEIKAAGLDELEQRAAQIADETCTADEARLDELNAELDDIEERRNVLFAEIEQRKADAQAIINGLGKEVIDNRKEERKMSDKEIRSTKEYVNAYVDYIKGKNDGSECRAMLKDAEYRMPEGGGDSSFKVMTENATNGIVPVPTYIEDRIQTAWDNDEIMNRVRKTFLKGNVKVGVEMAATGASIHQEGAAAPAAEELTLAIVQLVPQTVKKWISVSTEVMDMSGEAFLDYIYDEIVYQIVKKTASMAIEAIVNAPTSGSSAPIISEQTVSALGLADIVNAIGQLSGSAQNICFIANRATIAAYQALAIAANYAVDVFAGATVIPTDALLPFASATSEFAIVGDLSAIQANYPAGDDVKFVFDEFSLAEADLVKIVGRQYVAVGLVNNKAFTVLTK